MLEVQRLFCMYILERNDPIHPKSIRHNLFLHVMSEIFSKGLTNDYKTRRKLTDIQIIYLCLFSLISGHTIFVNQL